MRSKSTVNPIGTTPTRTTRDHHVAPPTGRIITTDVGTSPRSRKVCDMSSLRNSRRGNMVERRKSPKLLPTCCGEAYSVNIKLIYRPIITVTNLASVPSRCLPHYDYVAVSHINYNFTQIYNNNIYFPKQNNT